MEHHPLAEKRSRRKMRLNEMIMFRIIKTFFIIVGLSLTFAILVLLEEKGLQTFFDRMLG